MVFGCSVDCVATVPEMLVPVCVSVQVTIVAAIGPLFEGFVPFESTPVPFHVPAKLTGGEGSGGDPLGGGAVDSLDGDAVDPSPPPHEITNAVRAVAMMIGRTGFTTLISGPCSRL